MEKETILQKATKLAGNEEIANLLFKETTEILKEFGTQNFNLIKLYTDKLNGKINSLTESVENKDDRTKLRNLVLIDSIEYLLDEILMTASDISLISLNFRVPSFMYKAAAMFERQLVSNTYKKISSSILDAAILSKPEVSKDKLS